MSDPGPPDAPEVPFVLVDGASSMPRYARPGDAGGDLVARVGAVLTAGGGRALVPTGVTLALPPGYAGLVVPRSGLAAKHGVTCLNAPGLVDSGFRGEIQVLLVNTDPELDYEVHRGDRVAQLLVVPYAHAAFVEVVELPPSDRGSGGFGHTGR
ncbi:MAG TPA: dUTP diphosphatase [Acidimicrobiales bacterium]|nr:dUTP diphosphatase [Acidimicrobiales bacterium]HVC26445.1 dUTP diphosphatase [Acidimicrobiales bacterium]